MTAGGSVEGLTVELGIFVEGLAVKEASCDALVGGKGLPLITFDVLPAVDVAEGSVAGRWPWNWTFRLGAWVLDEDLRGGLVFCGALLVLHSFQ